MCWSVLHQCWSVLHQLFRHKSARLNNGASTCHSPSLWRYRSVIVTVCSQVRASTLTRVRCLVQSWCGLRQPGKIRVGTRGCAGQRVVSPDVCVYEAPFDNKRRSNKLSTVTIRIASTIISTVATIVTHRANISIMISSDCHCRYHHHHGHSLAGTTTPTFIVTFSCSISIIPFSIPITVRASAALFSLLATQ